MAQIPDPIAVTITADRTVFPFGGGSTVLRWETVGIQNIPADTIMLSPIPNGGDNDLVSWDLPVYGPTYNVTITKTTTFTITVRRASDGAVATASVTLTVPSGPQYEPPVVTLVIDTQQFPCSTKLLWHAENADTVVIDHGIGAVGANGSLDIFPDFPLTTYIITATNAYGVSTDTAMLLIGNPTAGVGVRAQFYIDTNLGTPAFLTSLPNIDINWGTGSPGGGIVAGNGWSTRFSGWIIPRYTQTYQFTAVTDDGVRLKICGNTVFDFFGQGSSVGSPESGSYTLHAGLAYPYIYDYYQNGNLSFSSETHFAWQSPSQAYEIIPSSQLFLGPQPVYQPVVTLVASLTTITAGQTLGLTWTSSQALTSIDQGIGVLSGDHGVVLVSPTTTTTYTLTGSTPGLPTTQVSVTVVVLAPGIPTDPSASGDCSGTILVTTQSASYATHYLLERSADDGQSWTQIADIVPAP